MRSTVRCGPGLPVPGSGRLRRRICGHGGLMGMWLSPGSGPRALAAVISRQSRYRLARIARPIGSPSVRARRCSAVPRQARPALPTRLQCKRKMARRARFPSVSRSYRIPMVMGRRGSPMSDTPRFAMPLLDAAQAQKHVSVNEALMRADLLAAGSVERRNYGMPPEQPGDGDVYIVANGASGAWAGKDGALALALNGGWEYVAPWEGAEFWVAAEGLRVTWRGGEWVEGWAAGTASGAATIGRVVTLDQSLSGVAVTTVPIIPDKAVVIGVTGRVLEAITGAASWSLGVAGGEDRYGSGYGTGAGSFAHGITGQPQAYYGDTSLVLTAAGGGFSGGVVRLAVHFTEILPPDPL